MVQHCVAAVRGKVIADICNFHGQAPFDRVELAVKHRNRRKRQCILLSIYSRNTAKDLSASNTSRLYAAGM